MGEVGKTCANIHIFFQSAIFFSFLFSKTGVGKLFGLGAFAGREHPYQITDEESAEGNGKQREEDKEGHR